MGDIYMKDIYELLNDIDLDISEFEDVKVSQEEREEVKKELKKRMKRRKPSVWKKTMTAASIAIGVSAASLFGLSFTTFAEEIPVIGGIFKLFNDSGLYEEYDANANKFNLVKEDQGIKVTINEAVFDGRVLYVTYEIESDKDLGPSPEIIGVPKINFSHTFFGGFKKEVKKTDENKYVGMTTGELNLQGKGLEKGNFEFEIEAITPDLESGSEITGTWNFEFDLEAIKNHEQVVELKSERDGVTFSLERITYTPMSFIINYDTSFTEEVDGKWDFEFVDIKEVRDNLGNVYLDSSVKGDSNRILYHSITVKKLDPDASSLIITPIAELSMADGRDEYGIYRHKNSKAPIEIFELEPIIVEIEK